MIHVQSVGFSYGPTLALRDVSFDIASGDITAIIGPNGSGKSTLARLMTGLLLPATGTVDIDGLVTGRDSDFAIRSTANLVWQSPDNQAICGVVEDDIAFGVENLGLSPPDVRARVDDALGTLGLGDMRSASIHTLTAAQRQTLAIAGIIAMRPRYIVLDEVTARLDAMAGAAMLDRLVDWSRRTGTALVLITHIMSEVLKAKHVIRLERHPSGGGIVKQIGSPTAVFASAIEDDAVESQRPEESSLLTMVAHLRKLGVLLDRPPESIDDLVDLLCN